MTRKHLGRQPRREREQAVLRMSDLPAAQHKVLREAGAYLSSRRARGYVVGGFLRDYLAGKISDDIDVVVDGVEPGGVAGHLSRSAGLSRPVVFPRFKTVLVAGAGIKVEVCRLEGDLAGDAARRDFTVNCLYADLASIRGATDRVAIADPTSQGLADLEAKVLRTPADELVTLWGDPLRILRAARFYAADGYRIPAGLVDAMGRTAYLLSRVSPERVRMEIERVLVSPRLESAIRLMLATGALAVVMPEVARADGFAQKTPYHAYDLFTHLVKTAAGTPPNVALRLAALLHDVGKLSTQMAKDDRMVYYGHEEASERAALAMMRRLKFPNRSMESVSFLVANHMINYSAAWSDRAVRRFVARMGPRLDQILTLAEADRRAQRPGRAGGRALADLSRRILATRAVRGHAAALPIDGRDIMRILGIHEGPLVGRAKAFLLEQNLKSPMPITRGQAIKALRKWSARADGAKGAGSEGSGRGDCGGVGKQCPGSEDLGGSPEHRG